MSGRTDRYLRAASAVGLLLAACATPPAPPADAGAPEPVQTLVSPALPTPSAIAASPVPTAEAPPAAIPEARRLTLEFPARMRAGVEGQIVRLTLEVDERGQLTPTAVIEGNTVVGERIEIPNVYETHIVIAEARLDLAGIVVQPSDSVFETLSPGRPVTFFWSIHPQAAGTFRGTVWLHLNFRNRVQGETERIAVSIQFIEVEVVDLFGLSASVARVSGVIGSVLGGVLGIPFLEDLLRFILKKSRRRNPS